jgi:hypothetical protein
MKKTVITTLFSFAALASVFASGYGYDAYGRYYQWHDTDNGGYGYDGCGKYYQWHNTDNGGYGYDGNGRYFQWHNNGW